MLAFNSDSRTNPTYCTGLLREQHKGVTTANHSSPTREEEGRFLFQTQS
jgi:hypothetical protein